MCLDSLKLRLLNQLGMPGLVEILYPYFLPLGNLDGLSYYFGAQMLELTILFGVEGVNEGSYPDDLNSFLTDFDSF